MLAHELLSAARMAIIERHAKALARGIAREVRAHRGEAEHADVSQFRHALVSSPARPVRIAASDVSGLFAARQGNPAMPGSRRVDTPQARP